MKILIYDFEIFRYDELLGVIELTNDQTVIHQIWGKENIKRFILLHQDNLWVGHNNIGYDRHILEACLTNKNLYTVSKKLVNSSIRPRPQLKTYQYDTMYGIYSLKVTELVVGKNISETPISFDLERRLTEEEKKQVESYNKDDLTQTLSNFYDQYFEFEMRLAILNEFGLGLESLCVTGTKLAAIVLGAKQVPGIENMQVRPTLYSTLQVKHKEVVDFYMNEDFRQRGKKLSVMLCGCEHTLGAGGIHAAQKKVHYERVLYFDVSGYYNLIMINYDLLPRTLPQKSKELYIHMYHEQLRLKKIDPFKRQVYKTILLSVFGAMMNEYTDFYDPWHGLLVTITGQIFLVDLLEKLEGLVDVIQSNTDGIMVSPHDWNDKDKILQIVEEWEARTGFVIKKEEIRDLYQRDVNCYFYRDSKNEPYVKGEAVRGYWLSDNPVLSQLWNIKEPAIIAKGICDYFLYNKLPETTVEEHKRKLIEFQYVVKKLSYDYMQYETYDSDGNLIESYLLQSINRAFPLKYDGTTNVIGKYKRLEDGKLKRTSVASLPDNVLVYDDEIISDQAIDTLLDLIDFKYYIDRIYERIQEFVNIDSIKEVKI